MKELLLALDRLLPNLPFVDVSKEVPDRDDWKEYATSYLESSDAVIGIVGPNTVDSEAVDWELREAIRLGKQVLVTTLSREFELPSACKDLGLETVPWESIPVAGRIGELVLPQELFRGHDWEAGDPLPEGVWRQYNLMVQSWEALIGRRQTVNTLYVSANAALLAGVGALLSAVGKAGTNWVMGGVLVLSFLGACLSFNWRRTVISYGVLSRAKAKVVEALETYLPARLFDAEWKVLEARRYKSTTDTDKQTALFFLLLFMAVFVIALGVALGDMF